MADRERGKLNEQERRCRERLAETDTDEELRRSLEQQIEVIESRRKAHADAERRMELVDAELGRLRQQVSLVREQALLSTDVDGHRAVRWMPSALRSTRRIAGSRTSARSSPASTHSTTNHRRRICWRRSGPFPDAPTRACLGIARSRVDSFRTGVTFMRSLKLSRGSAAGNIITLVLLLGIVGLGAWLWLGKKSDPAPDSPAQTSSRGNDSGEASKPDAGVAAPDGDAPSPIEPVVGTPTLEVANAFVPKDKTIRIDISEYAGYGGLIVANGGLEPNDNSVFAKEYGFKVHITVSEDETWSALNNGKLAATATTADALAVLGRQFDAVVPGADRLLARRGHGGRGSRHRLGQRAGRQDAGRLAVQRERVLHPLPRTGSRAARHHPARPRFEAEGRRASAWCSTRTPSRPATPTNMISRVVAAGSTAAWAGRRRPRKWSMPPRVPPRCWCRTATCWSSPTCWP